MESGVLWREEMQKLHDTEYQDVELSHMYADNCAMQLVRNPKQFDVIVTDNLFGDLLSDCAAMLTGSLGMLPSASLGAPDSSGRRKALYEPVHGSAPDIAGKNAANPLACMLSFAMMLRYSFDMGEEADLVEKAINNTLAERRAHRRHHAAGHEARLDLRDGQRRPRRAREAGLTFYTRHCEKREARRSNPELRMCSGLLRFASRNDG